tara:strand:+ start:96 stop:224 length:129 start_codon:yes stop_codon:yes gene_type:complete
MSNSNQTEEELKQAADQFWDEMEQKAAELEVTVDYYLEEFYC